MGRRPPRPPKLLTPAQQRVVVRARGARIYAEAQRAQAARDLALAYAEAAYSPEAGVGIRPLARELGEHAASLHTFIHRHLDPDELRSLPHLTRDPHHKRVPTPEQRSAVSAARAARRRADERTEASRLLVQRACQRAVDAGVGKMRLASELGLSYLTLRAILEERTPRHRKGGAPALPHQLRGTKAHAAT
jgi:hypothetical protein